MLRVQQTREAISFSTEPEEKPKCLIRLLGKNGNTIDTLRQLIRASTEEETVLRAFALQHPEMAEYIERALRYRIRLEEEFESLVSRNT